MDMLSLLSVLAVLGVIRLLGDLLLWLWYGFLWIPVLCWPWKKRSTIAAAKS
jgi:hypothetical protein